MILLCGRDLHMGMQCSGYKLECQGFPGTFATAELRSDENHHGSDSIKLQSNHRF